MPFGGGGSRSSKSHRKTRGKRESEWRELERFEEYMRTSNPRALHSSKQSLASDSAVVAHIRSKLNSFSRSACSSQMYHGIPDGIAKIRGLLRGIGRPKFQKEADKAITRAMRRYVTRCGL